jgi:hypothetical protein
MEVHWAIGLIDAGLIDQRFESAACRSVARDFLVTPVDAAQEKLTLVKSLLKNAIVSYAGPGIVRGGQYLLEDEDAARPKGTARTLY